MIFKNNNRWSISKAKFDGLTHLYQLPTPVSLSAVCSSASVFITKGPIRAIGSFSNAVASSSTPKKVSEANHANRNTLEYFVTCDHNVYKFKKHTHGYNMRTNIVIDDSLMNEALRFSGLNTKKEAVEEGLKALIRLKKQENIKNFRGKLQWEGDLHDMRIDK